MYNTYRDALYVKYKRDDMNVFYLCIYWWSQEVSVAVKFYCKGKYERMKLKLVNVYIGNE